MRNLPYFAIFYVGIFIVSCSDSKDTYISYDKNSAVINYGITKLSEQLKRTGYDIYDNPKSGFSGSEIYIISDESKSSVITQQIYLDNVKEVQQDGYKIINKDKKIYIIGKEERGCLYGMIDLIEQLRLNPDIHEIEERHVNPALSFRAVKFNLPWAPYRPGPATDIHIETCRDLTFWESFLDMMVENRLNVLSLWSTHLFPYLIKAKNYPKATSFTDVELND